MRTLAQLLVHSPQPEIGKPDPGQDNDAEKQAYERRGIQDGPDIHNSLPSFILLQPDPERSPEALPRPGGCPLPVPGWVAGHHNGPARTCW